MKTPCVLAVIIVFAWVTGGCNAPSVPAGGIAAETARWSVTAQGVARFELEQTGEKLSGVYEEGAADFAFHNKSSISGTVKGRKVSFSFFRQGNGEEGRGVDCLFTGTLDATTQTMSGHASLGQFDTGVSWTATRVR